MNNPEQRPTHRPLPDAELRYVSYSLGVQFHPPVKLGSYRQGGILRPGWLGLLIPVGQRSMTTVGSFRNLSEMAASFALSFKSRP